MENATGTSTNPEDYEVLIKRLGEGSYSSYCPQLKHMIKGQEHEEVEDAMWEHVKQHCAALEQK